MFQKIISIVPQTTIAILAVYVMRKTILKHISSNAAISVWGLVVIQLALPGLFRFSLKYPVVLENSNIYSYLNTPGLFQSAALVSEEVSSVSFYSIVKMFWFSIMVLLFVIYFFRLTILFFSIYKKRVNPDFDKLMRLLNVTDESCKIVVLNNFYGAAITPGYPCLLIGEELLDFSIDDLKMIIEHELAHKQMLHYLLRILIECLHCIYWFNPAMILLKKALFLEMEFAADEYVIFKTNSSIQNYAALLFKLSLKGEGFDELISCSRNHSMLKERLINFTMNKKGLKTTVVLTGLAMMITGFLTFYDKTEIYANQNNNNVVTAESMTIPVDNPEITCGWYCYDGHSAIDVKDRFNENGNVYSSEQGIIIETGYTADTGNYIVIAHNSELLSSYQHLDQILVHNGQTVSKREKIGIIGKTGIATGEHLHFEVIQNGVSINIEELFGRQ